MSGSITRGITRAMTKASIAASVTRTSGITSGVLDSLSGTAVVALGFRQLRAGYTGPAIRARRSSDNAETDIYFLANGDLDVSTLLSFASSGDCFASKWYDQSGNARDLIQTTLLAQPRIVLAGAVELINTRPTLRTGRVNGWYMTATGFTGAQPNTRSSVVQILDPANALNAVFLDSSNGTAPGNSLYMSSTTQMTMFRGTNLNGPNTIVANSQATSVEIANGASSSFYWNGTLFAGDAGTNGYDGLSVGAKRSIDLYGEMLCPEVIVYDGAMSNTDRLALTASQKAYYGTP